MKVLVTGANGYLGAGIVKAILDLGHEVVAADFATANVDERAVRKDCNLFELEDPYAFFDCPDVLLHLAWRDGFVHFSDAHMEDLPKHVAFLQKFAESDASAIAVMGTMHEIGFYEGCVSELTPCRPENFYGIAKNALRDATEVICRRQQKRFQWLRGFYIVGNTRFGASVFSKLAAAEEAGKTEFPFTMGVNQYDFIDYEEFIQQVAAAVTQEEINGIINICSGHPEKLADRMERFIRDNNFEIKLNYGAYPDREYDSKAIWGSDTKIRQILQNRGV